jgi:ATP-dependent protease ClpP protease subunit
MAFTDTVYATFAGTINQETLPKLMGHLSILTQQKVPVKTIHMLLQCTGGTVGDGVILYNYLRTYPVDLHIYNTGAVSSIAVCAYLGAPNRYVSRFATFMIHKSTFGLQNAAGLAKLRALAEALVLEDERSEAVLKAVAKIPADKWELHATQDVYFSAEEAVKFGIATAIREWDVPKGDSIWNMNA